MQFNNLKIGNYYLYKKSLQGIFSMIYVKVTEKFTNYKKGDILGVSKTRWSFLFSVDVNFSGNYTKDLIKRQCIEPVTKIDYPELFL